MDVVPKRRTIISWIPIAFLVATIVSVSMLLAATQPVEELQRITINYTARSASSWPMWIAKEGGYYEKYGLDVKLVFGVHPAGIAMVVSGEAVMTNYTLEQAMQAGGRDGSLVSLGSSFNKSLFALIAGKDIASVRDLKGKRIGVSAIGDAPYNYTCALLAKFGLTPRDVQWLPVGTDANGRAAALVSGRIDATLLTPPTYFKLEREGFKPLANPIEEDDIHFATVYLFKKSSVAANPQIAELLIKAHAEAIKRFYEDRAFAIRTYIAYDRQEPADVERIFDEIAKSNVLERVPYISASSVQYALDHAGPAAIRQNLDFRTIIDNSLVDRLVREGFFEKLFGPEIRAEQERKARLRFGR